MNESDGKSEGVQQVHIFHNWSINSFCVKNYFFGPHTVLLTCSPCSRRGPHCKGTVGLGPASGGKDENKTEKLEHAPLTNKQKVEFSRHVPQHPSNILPFLHLCFSSSFFNGL